MADIRAYLAERHAVEIDCVKTGTEAQEDEAGLYCDDADAWVVYGKMPNSNEIGWFFAGYTADLENEHRMEDR